jgi:hypothetical protein
MARFSVTDAAVAGFGVIRREPLAVLTWGLAILVVAVLPMAGLIWAIFPQFFDLVREAESQTSAATPGDPAMIGRIMQVQSQMMVLNVLTSVGGVALQAVLAGAVFRVVLEPDQRRFAFLRVGGQELWLGLLYLVLGILTYIAFLVAMLAVALLAGIAYLIGSSAGTGAGVVACVVVAIVAGLGAYAALIWAMLRLSMAGPMSFAERKFLLFESWAFTRGQAGALFGMALLVGLILIALELVIFALFGVGMFAVGARLLPQFQALEHQPPAGWARVLWPFVGVAAVVGSFLTAGVMALLFAPWATAYRDLRASAATPA